MENHALNLADNIQYEEFGINGRELIVQFGRLYIENKPEWQIVSDMCGELNGSLLLGDATGANKKLDFYIDQWKEQGILADDTDIPIWIQHFISFASRKIRGLESYIAIIQQPKSEKKVLDMNMQVMDLFR